MIQFVEHNPRDASSAFHHRGIDEIERLISLPRKAASVADLLNDLFAQINVRPAGEAILQILFALSLAQEHLLMHGQSP